MERKINRKFDRHRDKKEELTSPDTKLVLLCDLPQHVHQTTVDP